MERRAMLPAKVFPLAVLVSFMAMAGTTRASPPDEPASYLEQVEPICHGFYNTTEVLLPDADEKLRTGRLAWAGADLEKIGLALRKTYDQLRAIPGPIEYEAQLDVWLRSVQQAGLHYERAAKALRAGHRKKAQRVLLDGYPGVLAVDEALDFHYCRLEPPKITIAKVPPRY